MEGKILRSFRDEREREKKKNIAVHEIGRNFSGRLLRRDTWFVVLVSKVICERTDVY